jgi:hypothetical protein
MKHGQRLRLTRAAMAIAQRNSRNAAIMIPEGAIIELLNGPFDGVRLMDVSYGGETIMMFTNDMEHHTEAIKAETAWCCKILKFSRNERTLSDHEYKSAQDFVSKMDLGLYDGPPGLTAQVSKLSREQLEEIAMILIQRIPLGEKAK